MRRASSRCWSSKAPGRSTSKSASVPTRKSSPRRSRWRASATASLIGAASEFDLEQSRAGDRAGRRFARQDPAARRWATTSTCATSRAAARCCSARPRTTTRRARSVRSSALFDDGFALDDVRSAEITLDVHGAEGFHLRGASSMTQDQPRSRGPGRAGNRREPPVSRRLRAVPGHDVRPGQGSRRAGHGLHAQIRRPRRHRRRRAGRAREPA